MDYNEKDLMSNKEIKECIAQILSDFADFCNKNDLHYQLTAGTLLGAIRHKGFIPWDDDIDVAMPREDYDRLHKILKTTKIKPNYEICSLLAGNSDYPFAKIVDTNTKIVNANNNLLNHLWIDIFPIDGVSNEQAKDIIKESKKTTIWLKLLCKSAKNLKYYGLKETLIVLSAHIKKPNYYADKLDKFARQHKIDDCEYVAEIAWGSIYRCMKKDIYFTLTDTEFEGRMYKAPKNYDTFLKVFYGDDYMQLPPEDQRDTHDIKAIRLK